MSEYWEIIIKPAEEVGKIVISTNANLPPRSIRTEVIIPVEDLVPLLEEVSKGIKKFLVVKAEVGR